MRAQTLDSKQDIAVSVRIHFVTLTLSGIHLSAAHPAWLRQGTGWVPTASPALQLPQLPVAALQGNQALHALVLSRLRSWAQECCP